MCNCRFPDTCPHCTTVKLLCIKKIEDLYLTLDSFLLGHNKAIISALSIQNRALPPRPIPCSSGTFTGPSSPQQYTDPCLRIDASSPANSTDEDPYTTFCPVSHFTGRRSSNDTSESDDHGPSKSTTSQGSSNGGEIYSEPYDWIVKSTPQGNQSLLTS